MKCFEMVHPKNGFDIVVKVDENYKIVDVCYTDGESVDLNMGSIVTKIRDEIRFYYDL